MKTRVFSLGINPQVLSRFLVSLSVLLLIAAVLQAPSAAQAPSFSFSATVPPTVEPGVTFFVPATITDTGGPAEDYHSFFQVYDSNFLYLSQTYYDNQTFDAGQTLDYDVPLTAPTTPGYYWVAALVFNQNYTGGILAQQFFLPTFTVEPVPEPSYGLPFGLLLVGLLGATSIRKNATKVLRQRSLK